MPKEPMVQEYLTVSEVAALTGLHRNTIYNLVRQHGLPAFKTPTGLILIRRDDLERYLEVL